MSTESRADVVAMFRDWDRADFQGEQIPGAFEASFVEPLELVGRNPSFTCAGERRSAITATLYGKGGVRHLVTVDDTLDQVVRQSGDREGPFTVKTLIQDGTGTVVLVLEEP